MSAPLTMRRAALIGTPITHSLSPAFQNAAFRAAGIAARYDLADISADHLTETVAQVRGAEWLGANVTVPYKEAVVPLLDEISDDARTVGAVNTIIARAGRLTGANTDIPGFAADLRAHAIPVQDATVLLLGAGGSARAVAQALWQMGAAKLVIANRTVARAEAIIAHYPAGWAHAVPLHTPEHHTWLGVSRLVVNAIPGGIYTDDSAVTDDEWHLLHPDTWVYDLVYRTTPLLHRAASRGLRTANGLGMLVRQGAYSWEMWTGQPAPLDAMWDAIREESAQ